MLYDTSNNRFKVNESFFDDPLLWTEAQAYWFGWLVADGYNDCMGRSICLRLATEDKCVLEVLRSLIGYTGQVRDEVRHQRVTKIGGQQVLNNQNRAILAISNRNLSARVKELGIMAGKSSSFAIPEMASNCFRHFLRGLFEGDGCFSFSKWNKFESNLIAAPNTLASIQDWFDHHEILTHITKDDRVIYNNGARTLRICGNNTGMRLFLLLYSDCQYYLPRKLQAFIRLYHYKSHCLLKVSERDLFQRFKSAILPYATPDTTTN